VELRAPRERHFSGANEGRDDQLAFLCRDRLAIEAYRAGAAFHTRLFYYRKTCDTGESVQMRIGLLGPSEGDVASLGRASEFLLNSVKVHHAVYLGVDGALDRAVATWARKLVGDDPSDESAWRRAAEIAVTGTPAQIDKFVSTERSRVRLKALEALPDSSARTIEMVGDRVAVLIHDKASLDEEDILAANILVFGKSDVPVVKKIGARWFVSPGQIGSPGGGLCVLDDEHEEILLTIYDGSFKPVTKETLVLQRATKVQILGDA
jgi:hypothetical protein